MISKNTIKKELEKSDAIKRCADHFGVVGDTNRLKICWLLCHHPELSVSDIADLLSLEQSSVSHALRKLREAGVVSCRKEAKYSFYSLTDAPICGFLKERIS